MALYGTNRYYVYEHIDKFSNGGEKIYIGHGCGSRAWMSDKPFRDEKHAAHLQYLEGMGLLPSDWVKIIERNLTKEEACERERNRIQLFRPRFNKIQGQALLKVTPDMLAEAFELRDRGMTYAQIAEHFEIATMTVHRAINRKSPALEEVLARQI